MLTENKATNKYQHDMMKVGMESDSFDIFNDRKIVAN